MIFSKRIDKFFFNFKKYLFTFKNGFFELPYLANSPHSMLQSFVKMPFVKHFPNDQLVRSNTPFLKASMRYQDIEKGLLFLLSDAQFKANVNFKLIYDKHLPIDWYFLTFHVS